MLVKQLGPKSPNGADKPPQGMTLDDYRHGPVRMMPVHKPADKFLPLGERSAKPAFMPLHGQGSASIQVAAAKRTAPVVDKEQFLRDLLPEAEAAAKELGVDPKMLLSQAALETGWGRHTVRGADGSDSHNLFGIKAGKDWEGQRVATTTLEYVQGVPVRKTDYFRAYDSYKDCFHDYVAFLRDNPRYAQAIEQGDDPHAFFAGLQRAGYATDPRYANKVLAIYRQLEDYDVGATNVAAATAPATTTTTEAPVVAAAAPAEPDPAQQAPVADSSTAEPAPSESGEENA
ncbi:flagellar assembly peptidoglycan hydrolase FlgJ [Methylogaea oryzae]|nr:flagellar assembly peptidoglycan hydrolase FlgJ [Methylogaea oryzae]